MFPCMKKTVPLNHVRRAIRQTGKTARRGFPALVAVLILAGLVGTSIAGAFPL